MGIFKGFGGKSSVNAPPSPPPPQGLSVVDDLQATIQGRSFRLSDDLIMLPVTEAGAKPTFLVRRPDLMGASWHVTQAPREDELGPAKADLNAYFLSLLRHVAYAPEDGPGVIYGLPAPHREALREMAFQPPADIAFTHLDGAETYALKAGESELAVTGRDIAIAMRFDYRLAAQKFVRGEPFLTPCIGDPSRSVETLCIALNRTDGLFQCRDPQSGLRYVFYLIYNAGSALVWVWFPDNDLVLYPRAKRPVTARDFNRQIGFALRLILGASEAPAWARSPRRAAYATWTAPLTHIGHRVWNEFSSIHELLDGGEGSMAVYDLASAGGVEHYGPIEKIFDRVSSVYRSEPDLPEAFAQAVSNGEMIIPYRGSFIYADVARRIRAACRSYGEAGGGATVAGPERARQIQVVLGLRLHDRTAADLVGVYAAIIGDIAAEYPDDQVRVIFDGMNRLDTGEAGKVFSPGHDSSNILAAEEAFCHEVMGRLSGAANVSFLICVGMTLRENIFHIAQADLFIAPMGGGFAKYRWVCNLPGFALISNMNRTHSRWAKIYDDPAQMEEQASQFLIPEACTTDIVPPDMQFDANGKSVEDWRGDLSNLNFEIDRKAASQFIRERLPAMRRQARVEETA